jgi:hypothetical protein
MSPALLSRLPFWITCLALGLTAPARAQKSQPVTPPPPPPQSLSFFVFPPPGEAPLEEVPATVYVAGRPKELKLPVGVLSEPLFRPAAAGLVLHRALPARPNYTLATPAPVPPELARVDFPENWKNVLILAAPSPSGDKAQLRAHDVSESVLPPGTLGLYNFSGRQLAVQLNQARALAPPGALTPIPLQTRTGRTGGVVQLRIATQSDGQWKLAARQTLSLSNTARNFALAYPSGDGVALVYLHPPLDPSAENPAPAQPASATP